MSKAKTKTLSFEVSSEIPALPEKPTSFDVNLVRVLSGEFGEFHFNEPDLPEVHNADTKRAHELICELAKNMGHHNNTINQAMIVIADTLSRISKCISEYGGEIRSLSAKMESEAKRMKSDSIENAKTVAQDKQFKYLEIRQDLRAMAQEGRDIEGIIKNDILAAKTSGDTTKLKAWASLEHEVNRRVRTGCYTEDIIQEIVNIENPQEFHDLLNTLENESSRFRYIVSDTLPRKFKKVKESLNK